MKNKGNIFLLLAAIVWGISFVSQSVGVESLSPFAFNGIRMLLGSVSLLPIIAVQAFAKKKKGETTKLLSRDLIIGAVICGVILGIASGIQTYAMKFTTAGKCGFITALYILFVPIVGAFFGKRVTGNVVLGVVIALFGMYFLCIHGTNMDINTGDVLTFICSLCFTGHIIAVDYFSPKVDSVVLSCLQFFISGVINCIVMLFFELPTWGDIVYCAVPILYAGIMSCGVAYTFQILGQKGTQPAIASILMSFESVFAVVAGFIIIGDKMSQAEFFGCFLMFGAIIIAQLPKKPNKCLTK